MENYIENAQILLREFNVKFTIDYVKFDYHFAGDEDKRNIYNVTFSRLGDKLKFKFGQSINKSMKKITPTEYDVLACITKNDPGKLEDFCDEFGYDTDSISANKTYKLVCIEYEKVYNFFTSEEIELLQEIN